MHLFPGRSVLAFSFFFLFFISMPNVAPSEEPITVLSSKAAVSVITMAPGKEIYIAFGHNAIRVRDPVKRIDLIYNYGSFDFEDPLFIPKFVYGDLNYYLSYFPFASYMKYDTGEQNRIWSEQVLDLNQNQVNRVYSFLLNNAREENKFYRYDFIRDNCATRIPDALIKALGDEIRFAETAPEAEGKSFRQMSNEYLGKRTFYRFLFFLVLGTAADKTVTPFESSFVPHYLMKYLEGASVEKNGKWVPLVISEEILFEPDFPSEYGSPSLNPAFLLWPLFLAVLLLTGFSIFRRVNEKIPVGTNMLSGIFDFMLFFVTGLFGCILVYLDFFSVHTATKGNLNLLWMWPTHLVASFFFLRKKRVRLMGYYFLLSASSCIWPLLCWSFWPQQMESAMIPLMLIMAARAGRYFDKTTG